MTDLESTIKFFFEIAQIAISKVNSKEDLENLIIRTASIFYFAEDPLEINEFDILTILGNVGG